MADVLAYLEEVVVIIISIVAIYLIVRFRSRVLALLTGDDRFHADVFDSCWYVFFRCCGFCTGNWTKCISCCPCWDCCGLRDMNLVDAFGRWSGLLQWDVNVRHITVGDLPHEGPAYYYVSFEVGEHPPQGTAVSQLVQPKLIRFHGECVLRVRDSSLDNNVRVVVKEMRTIGSPEICELYLRPDKVVEWATENRGRTMRFQMQPKGDDKSNLLPGWILLTFDLTQPWEDHHHPGHETSLSVGREHPYRSVNDFKTDNPLVNTHGIPVREPSETDVAEFQRLLWMRSCMSRFLRVLLILSLVAALTFRTAVSSCYRDYQRQLILHKHGVEFPVERRTKEWVLQRCGYSLRAGIMDQLAMWAMDLQEWQGLFRIRHWLDYVQYWSPSAFEGRPLEAVKPVFSDFGGEQRILVEPNSTDCQPNKEETVQCCYNLPVGAGNPWLIWGFVRCQRWTCRYRVILVPMTLLVAVILAVSLGMLCCLHRYNSRKLHRMRVRLVEEASFNKHTATPEEALEDNLLCCGLGSRRTFTRANGTAPQSTHVPIGGQHGRGSKGRA